MLPVTLYQAQNSLMPNAALYFISGEGHVVFSGPVLSLLTPEELKSVIGHELAHYHLWQWEQGELHIVDQLVQAVANDPRASSSHAEIARRFQLYTEIFADRGSLCVTGDVNPGVAGLVKLVTRLAQVSAPGYLKQAEEIFAKDAVATEGVSHPEAFNRARSAAMWSAKGDDATPQIASMIEGVVTFEGLDLIDQARLVKSTRWLLEQFLQPKWFQTPAVLGHVVKIQHLPCENAQKTFFGSERLGSARIGSEQFGDLPGVGVKNWSSPEINLVLFLWFLFVVFCFAVCPECSGDERSESQRSSGQTAKFV